MVSVPVGGRGRASSAGAFAAAAFVMGLSSYGSDWNWFGFSASWTLVNITDRVIGYALMGVTLGALVTKWSGRQTTDEWSGVRASGGYAPPRTSHGVKP